MRSSCSSARRPTENSPPFARRSFPREPKQAAIVFRVYRVQPPHAGAGVAAWEAWVHEEYDLANPGPDASEADWLAWSDAVNEKAQYQIVPLALPAPEPHRIIVFGDTGCRIKGRPCRIAPIRRNGRSRRSRPRPPSSNRTSSSMSAIICIARTPVRRDFAGCAGTPYGDNWPTWDADFFTPAKPLLAAAPWVFVRGNHEDCERAGLGWLRLLGPLPFDPAAPCAAHLAPYSVPHERGRIWWSWTTPTRPTRPSPPTWFPSIAARSLRWSSARCAELAPAASPDLGRR